MPVTNYQGLFKKAVWSPLNNVWVLWVPARHPPLPRGNRLLDPTRTRGRHAERNPNSLLDLMQSHWRQRRFSQWCWRLHVSPWLPSLVSVRNANSSCCCCLSWASRYSIRGNHGGFETVFIPRWTSPGYDLKAWLGYTLGPINWTQLMAQEMLSCGKRSPPVNILRQGKTWQLLHSRDLGEELN